MKRYVAGWNMPGYLPNTIPLPRFDTFDEARRYIIDELKFQEDQAEEEDLAEEFCHLAEDVNLESSPFTTPEIDGYVYFVDIVEDDEESEES